MSQLIESSEDWMIMGMIHAFKILDEVRKTDNDLNDVDFEFLVEVQKRNLSNPKLGDDYNKIFVKSTLEDLK
jgi:hypothetical protein